MKKKLFLFGLIFLLLLVFCGIKPEFTYWIVRNGAPPAYSMQQQKNWCGIACLEMYSCFKYSGNPYKCKSQSEIANLADTDPPYEGILSLEEISNYMNNYLDWGAYSYYCSYWTTFLEHVISFVRVHNEPFICRLTSGDPIGHWILVVGYRVPFEDPYAIPEGIVYADPASVCDADRCYGLYYDVTSSVFQSMTGVNPSYVGISISPKVAPDIILVSTEEDPYQPPPVYTNYYNYLSKEAPGSDGRDLDDRIPFADGSNGLEPELVERIIQASDSVLGAWGVENLIGLDPDYAKQFDGAHAAGVEFVTNTAYLRYGDPGQFPCDIYCGGQEFFSVTYIDKTENYYVGMVRVKLLEDSLTFEGGGISGFIITGGTVSANQNQSSLDKPTSPEISETGFVTREELHELYPGCTFFPFWDLNECSPTPLIPFWYVKRPDGTRFILDSWGREFVRDAETEILYLKRYEKNQTTAPENYLLSQNYPNPFNAETQIYFIVKDFSNVELTVYNALGQKVKTLVKGDYQSGEYRIIWDGTNENREGVSSGIYFYKLQIGSHSESRKMILAK